MAGSPFYMASSLSYMTSSHPFMVSRHPYLASSPHYMAVQCSLYAELTEWDVLMLKGRRICPFLSKSGHIYSVFTSECLYLAS